MTTVTMDDAALTTLRGPNALIAVSDAAGRVVGFFAPVDLELAAQYAAGAAHFYPGKDAAKRGANGLTFTTAQVKDYLRSMETR